MYLMYLYKSKKELQLVYSAGSCVLFFNVVRSKAGTVSSAMNQIKTKRSVACGWLVIFELPAPQ